MALTFAGVSAVVAVIWPRNQGTGHAADQVKEQVDEHQRPQELERPHTIAAGAILLAGKSAEDVLEGVALLLGTIGVVSGIGAVDTLLLGCIGSRVLDLLVVLIDLVHLL